ncbi:MAG: dolichyl-phosphate beta-glucosyltransferase [Anaerolineaceae bacterium]
MDTLFLSIIIPAHNEAERLPTTLNAIQEYLQNQPFQAEVLVVENGSTDETAAVVQEWQEHIPWLRLLSLAQSGKGYAVQQGMLAARGEYRFMADADLSMPIGELGRFLKACQEGAEVVIGSRELPGSKRIGEPLNRHLVGRAFNTMVKWVALPGLQDTQCGFKCFRAQAAERVFTLQTLTGWSFDVEVLVIARELGYRIAEVPITWVYNPGSRVKVLQDSIRMAEDLWYIRHNTKRGRYRASQV